MRFFSLRNNAAWLLCGSALIACTNQTGIQRDYVAHRNGCQGFAESNVSQFVDPNQGADDRTMNAKLVTLFSDCMFEQGWTVATPQREEDILESEIINATAPAPANIVNQPVARPQAPQPLIVPQAPEAGAAASGAVSIMDDRRAPAQNPQ